MTGALTGTVSASPTKSLFVSMLTRDIKLEDAVLDLLDNCVDGILRSGENGGQISYSGFKAEIKFDAELFSISDNCGGIPWSSRNYAFRMGRPPGEGSDVHGSVGVYGIGMKRAIFKIGRRCSISTRNANDQYEIKITRKWMEDEKTWEVPVEGPVSATGADTKGTTITVGDLRDGIAELFTENEHGESFSSSLNQTIAAHYAYILDKGFEVTINGAPVEPKTIEIVCSNKEKPGDGDIMPFVFKGEMDGVKVFLAVGLTGQIPSGDEIGNEQEAATRSSMDAGWTVVCNGRVVLYCDRTELTGWGEGNVPHYHTQFIAISGIVEFESDDPAKLPTTTTKRGIDAASTLYLQVKNKMREGTKVFTAYTNKWKGREGESEDHIKQCSRFSLSALKTRTETLQFQDTPTPPHSQQYKPSLPSPSRSKSNKSRITFMRDKSEINAVAEYFGKPGMSPSDVGASCFDFVYGETGQ